MAIVDPDRINAIKARVKAECLRRCHTGSVAQYGASGYDFSNAPASDIVAASEHYSKDIDPLHAINPDVFPDIYGPRVITDADLLAQEAFLAVAEKTDVTSTSHNDCAASCTGLCLGCTGTCGGACTGSCGSNCTGGCSSTCTGDCDTSCSSCTGGCAGCDGGCRGCTGSCAGGCTGGCGGCATTCMGSCRGYCKGSCETNCQGIQTGYNDGTHE